MPRQKPEWAWMSCSREVDWTTSRHRHLTRTSTDPMDRGWTDTACGASGTPGSFRRSSAKPPCPGCCTAAGIPVPNHPGSVHPTERGSRMTTTPKSKHDTPPKASKAPRDKADLQAQARAAADRAKRKGEDWTTAYIRAWRRLSGLKRTPVGPVA